jgi:hypothetical protein
MIDRAQGAYIFLIAVSQSRIRQVESRNSSGQGDSGSNMSAEGVRGGPNPAKARDGWRRYISGRRHPDMTPANQERRESCRACLIFLCFFISCQVTPGFPGLDLPTHPLMLPSPSLHRSLDRVVTGNKESP